MVRYDHHYVSCALNPFHKTNVQRRNCCGRNVMMNCCWFVHFVVIKTNLLALIRVTFGGDDVMFKEILRSEAKSIKLRTTYAQTLHVGNVLYFRLQSNNLWCISLCWMCLLNLKSTLAFRMFLLMLTGIFARSTTVKMATVFV